MLISPVTLLTKTSPAGEALKMPPDGLFITGTGFAPVAQNVPVEYWNWGLYNGFMVTVTGDRELMHVPVVFCT